MSSVTTFALSASAVLLAFLLSACVDNKADELLEIVDQETAGTAVNNNDTAVSSIAISTREISLNLGLSETLSVIQLSERGATIALVETAIWESENPQIASIDSEGVVTAHQVGLTKITASWRGFSDSISVSVDDAILQDFSLTPVSLEFDECQSAQINASALFSDGSARSLPTAVSWSLEGLNAGSVIPDGDTALVQASASGAGALILGYEDVSVEAPIVVLDTLESISIDTSSYAIVIGSTIDLTVLGSYSTDSTPVEISGGERSLEHPLPETPALSLSQTVAGTLQLNALALGTANLHIFCGGMTLTQQFEVVPEPTLQSITILDGEEIDFTAGQSIELSLVAMYSDGHSEIINRDIDWSLTENDHLAFTLDLSDPEGAQITADEELTYEHGAVLQAQYQDMLVSTNIYALRDTPDSLNSISMIYIDNLGNEFQLINGNSQTVTAAGTLTLALDGEFDSGTKRIPTDEIFWSNSDPAIATVDAQGVVTAVAAGTASISALYREQTITLPLIVTP